MASTLMRGNVTLADGTTHEWTAGPRERIKAERALGTKLTDMKGGNIGEEYLAFVAWASLQRQGVAAAAGTFDEFLDHLDDWEIDASAESEAPPAS